MLPARCHAAVATAPGTTELHDLPLPRIGPDDGLLRVEAAGICGTGWELYLRESRGRGLGPLILGHENVGQVVALGERAAERWGVTDGDHVAVEEFLPCGTCRLCRAGSYRLCEAIDSRSGRPFLHDGGTPLTVPPGLYGGFSQYLYLHPRAIVHPIGVRGHDQRSVAPAIDLIRSNRFPLHLLCTHAFGLHEADRALRVAGARLDREAIHVSIVP